MTRDDLPAVLAGVAAVVVGFSGPTALIFSAASAGGLNDAQVSSWLWAVAMGSGVAGLFMSWRYRLPVITAWSTPGVALLAAALPTTPWDVAVGAFVVGNALILALGLSGAFGRVMAHVPPAIASGLLGGILFPFAAGTLPALAQAPWVVGAMVLAFFGVRRLAPLWAVPTVFAAGLVVAAITGALRPAVITLAPALPVFTTPRFDLGAMLGLALPLALVGLTGQFLSGFAVLRANGFLPPEDRATALMGGLSVLLASFGCHGVNPSAIIAAICVGPEAHPDPARRWIAGVTAGVTYLVFGTFAASVAGVFAALPPPLIAALAGLALLPAMTGALAAALADAQSRDAAAVTFVVTAAGVAFLGLGAAFWGLLAGFAVRALRRRTL